MGSFFQDRSVMIATMHGKEEVLSEILASVGMEIVTSENLNTDQFGTFSGEIPRHDDSIVTLRKKCLLANQVTGIDLVVASEGSFGQHPFIPFISADEEFLMLKDFKTNFEIVVKELSTDTNFESRTISDSNELRLFAEKIGFPDHGLILKSENRIEKGLRDNTHLEQIFNEMLIKDRHGVVVETDMRAMNNPTRMKVIGLAALKLKNAILSCCPKCRRPDFTVKDFVPGLPCEGCHMPTESVLLEILKCNHCGITEERMSKKKFEDPMFCNYCNP